MGDGWKQERTEHASHRGAEKHTFMQRAKYAKKEPRGPDCYWYILIRKFSFAVMIHSVYGI